MEYRYRPPEPDYSLWWQIALGGFLALTGHSIVTGLYARHEAAQALQQLNAEAKKLNRQLQQAPAPTYVPPTTYRTAPQRNPLREDERCIQGRRFKRIENGWTQLPYDPC